MEYVAAIVLGYIAGVVAARAYIKHVIGPRK